MGICKICGKKLSKINKLCCSRECTSEYRSRLKIERNNQILNEWVNGNITNCICKNGPETGELLSRVKIEIIKPYLLEEQNHKCSICGQEDYHNNKELIFILDHIDGDWLNNYKPNLRLICPNCNSQLETTKHHRGQGRYSTRLYQKIHRDNLNHG